MCKKMIQCYLKMIETICVTLLMLVLACMCIQIGCRLFSIGQSFTEELSRLSFSLMIFLGMPLALAEGADIAVDMLVNLLPFKIRRGIDILVDFMITGFGVFCIRSLFTFMRSNKDVTAVSLSFIKMNWIYGTFLFSFFSLVITSLIKAYAAYSGRNQTLDIHQAEKEKEKQQEQEVDLGI